MMRRDAVQGEAFENIHYGLTALSFLTAYRSPTALIGESPSCGNLFGRRNPGEFFHVLFEPPKLFHTLVIA